MPNADEPSLPRWAQMLAGIVFLPMTALALIGAISIFGLPHDDSSARVSEPVVHLFAGVMVLLCLWAGSLAIRLIRGRRSTYGLFGPFSLRVIAVGAIGLGIGGIFTGAYVEHPVRSSLMAIAYVILAIRFWQMSVQRSRNAA